MASSWRKNGEERGAYTTVAQTETASANLTVHGKDVANEEDRKSTRLNSSHGY